MTTVDITTTRGEMALFDQLIAAGLRTTVVDVGYGSFDKFFSVLIEIGFVREAHRRGIEPVILFVSDTAPLTARAYAELRERDYPLLAPSALAERLRKVAELFPPNSGFEFAILYKRRA